ncbi:MAG TPA: phosphotransferase [Actinomycetota bacterium]|nr:phosphotransferase [Actinomycetota bacterium]
MTDFPIIASGRDSIVLDMGDGRVLRRFVGHAGAEDDADIMEYVRAYGYPVPAVHDAGGCDLIMDKIEGPTMSADLRRRPWMLKKHARALGLLHKELHRIPAPTELKNPTGRGGSLLHMDLHPENVIMSPDGPAVIDWTNACGGEAGLDVAMTWIILSTSAMPARGPKRTLEATGRALFLRHFLKAADPESWLHLGDAARLRLGDGNLTSEEKKVVAKVLEHKEVQALRDLHD